MFRRLIWFWLVIKDFLHHDFHALVHDQDEGLSDGKRPIPDFVQPDKSMPEHQLRVAVKMQEQALYEGSKGSPREEYEAEAIRLPLDDIRGYEDVRQIKRVHAILDFIGTGKTVLDCAGGSGYIANLLQNAGNDVTVMDYSLIHLNRAKWLRKLKTVHGRVEKLPFPDQSFDVVLMAEVLEHCESMSTPFAEAERVVKEDGQIVITIPIHESHDAYQEHLKQIRMTNIDGNMIVLSIKNILPHLQLFREKNRNIKNS
jgi:ubiquinone/menaquinone biosynthesis C-methylase UbiE